LVEEFMVPGTKAAFSLINMGSGVSLPA
jgi:hypothetical protein